MSDLIRLSPDNYAHLVISPNDQETIFIADHTVEPSLVVQTSLHIPFICFGRVTVNTALETVCSETSANVKLSIESRASMSTNCLRQL